MRHVNFSQSAAGVLVKCLAPLALLMALCLPGQAQQLTVSGTVVATQGATPLTGVSVQVAGTTTGTTTDARGNFSLQAPVGSLLSFSYLGYITKKIKVTSAAHFTVQLAEDVTTLNSVVVVGYGTQKKVNLTGSIATLDMDTKANQPLSNASNALHGMSGVFVNLDNSQPGLDRSTIRIRGVGTLNNNDPLVLVDGVEYPMDELNPNDIASVTVLKDASAAIYGSRAANGVILVTTKQGHGSSKVNYSYYYGIQKATYLPDAIWDPIAYLNLMNQAAANEGKAPYFTQDEISEYQAGMKTDPFTYPSINWFDRALKTGTIQKHDLSFSGGSQKYQYRLSLGYLNRDGIIIGPGNKDQKYSIGLNSSLQVSKRLRVGLTLNGYYRYYTEPGYTTSSFWQYLMRALPIENDTLADGNYGYSYLRVPGRNNWEQPRMIADGGSYTKYVQRFVASVFADYTLPWDITYNIKFGVDKYDGILKVFIPQMVKEQAKTGTMYNWNSPTTAPRAQNTDYNDLNLHFYNTLNWHHTFAQDHHLQVMAGASYDRYSTGQFMAEMTGYLDATLTAISAGTIFEAMSGNDTQDALESYFGRLNYDYKGKYLLEAILRADGSARFRSGTHRWGMFPGVSAGWRVDKEPFFGTSSVVSLLKLRASVGKLGNQAVPLFSYLNSIELGQDYSFGGTGGTLASGAAQLAYSDPNITWESTTDYDLGVDVDLLQNKISLTADVYRKHTTDILRQVNLADQVGDLDGPQENLGVVDNDGVELSAQYRDNIGPFDYNVYGNVAYNRNRVKDLDGQILYNYNTNLSTITEKGHPIDAFYLYQAIGIFQSQQEVDNSPKQSGDTGPGWIKYKDVNGDGKINGDDRVATNISSVMPKYTYGFGLDVSYKGVSLNAFFQGVAGIKIFPTANYAFPLNNGAGATKEWLTESWTPDRPNAKLPAIIEASYGSKENYLPSTFWLKNGSYLRLKSVQLSYALPERWVSRAKIQKLSVFLNAENWLTFAKYKEFDPESTVNVSSLYHYPMLKTLSGGINVTF